MSYGYDERPLYYNHRFYGFNECGDHIEINLKEPIWEDDVNYKWRTIPIDRYNNRHDSEFYNIVLDYLVNTKDHPHYRIDKERHVQLHPDHVSPVIDEMIRCSVDYRHNTELSERNYVIQHGRILAGLQLNDKTKLSLKFIKRRLSHQLVIESKVIATDGDNDEVIDCRQISFRDYKWLMQLSICLGFTD